MTEDVEEQQSDLWQEVVSADERAREGRVERLRILNNGVPTEMVPIPALASQYYEDARICWYTGAFIATILMAQLSFEEFFRSHYRAVHGVGGKLPTGSRVDKASFAELLNQARADRSVSEAEFRLIDEIRTTRNAYVHTKDTLAGDTGKPNFFDQTLKVAAPHLMGVSAEDEARKCISTLAHLFAPLCLRSWGLIHPGENKEA